MSSASVTNKIIKTSMPLVVLGMGIFIAWWLSINKPKIAPKQLPPEIPLVKTVTVYPDDVRLSVNSQGSVNAKSEIDLVVEMSGRVVNVSADFAPGGFFKKGQVLVRLDPKDYDLNVVKAKASVAQAERKLQRLRVESEISRKNWQAIQGNENKEPNNLILKKPQIAEAEANLQAANAELADARLRRSRTVIRAPYDGRVKTKLVDLGQYVTVGQALGRIYSIDVAEIRLPLSDVQLSYLELPHFDNYRNKKDKKQQDNLPNVIISSVFAGQEYQWTGKIVRTEASIKVESRALNVVAEIDDPYGVKNKDNKPPLSVGMFVDAEITGRLAKNVFILPRQAVLQNNKVMIVNDDNILRFKNVTLLRNERNRVLVSNGLNAGDKVIVSPLDSAVDGMKVRLPNASSYKG